MFRLQLTKIVEKIRQSLIKFKILSKEVNIKNVKFDRFIPYDLVMDSKSLKELQDPTLPVGETVDISRMGVVIGFVDATEGVEPKLITVAHFNNLVCGKPTIKVYNADELSLIQSPVEQLQVLASMLHVSPPLAQGYNNFTNATKKIKETIH